MRLVFVTLLLIASLGAARAEGDGCLSQADMQEVVSASRVVSPKVALQAAQQAVPKADMVRARLCRSGQAYVYVFGALRRDGRFVEVTVDATSGRIASSR